MPLASSGWDSGMPHQFTGEALKQRSIWPKIVLRLRSPVLEHPLKGDLSTL